MYNSFFGIDDNIIRFTDAEILDIYKNFFESDFALAIKGSDNQILCIRSLLKEFFWNRQLDGLTSIGSDETTLILNKLAQEGGLTYNGVKLYSNYENSGTFLTSQIKNYDRKKILDIIYQDIGRYKESIFYNMKALRDAMARNFGVFNQFNLKVLETRLYASLPPDIYKLSEYIQLVAINQFEIQNSRNFIPRNIDRVFFTRIGDQTTILSVVNSAEQYVGNVLALNRKAFITLSNPLYSMVAKNANEALLANITRQFTEKNVLRLVGSSAARTLFPVQTVSRLLGANLGKIGGATAGTVFLFTGVVLTGPFAILISVGGAALSVVTGVILDSALTLKELEENEKSLVPFAEKGNENIVADDTQYYDIIKQSFLDTIYEYSHFNYFFIYNFKNQSTENGVNIYVMINSYYDSIYDLVTNIMTYSANDREYFTNELNKNLDRERRQYQRNESYTPDYKIAMTATISSLNDYMFKNKKITFISKEDEEMKLEEKNNDTEDFFNDFQPNLEKEKNNNDNEDFFNDFQLAIEKEKNNNTNDTEDFFNDFQRAAAEEEERIKNKSLMEKNSIPYILGGILVGTGFYYLSKSGKKRQKIY